MVVESEYSQVVAVSLSVQAFSQNSHSRARRTTIIESLKYAVTGSLPPGKNAGQSFVHDPKSIGHQSVKANIKLRLTNRAGQQMVVIRSMELTQKKKAMTFKALDGILRTTDSRTGEKVSLSHKCSELDRQIPMLLGVSKPILEHVVFCHQEDSSWPLQESTVLKTRFDAIFDSTRYAKALKAITDTKKEYSGIVKDLKAELAGLAAHKQAAKGFREELEQFEEDLEVLETNLQGTNDEIKQVNEEIQRNRAIAQEVEEQRLIIEDKETELAKEISVLDAHRNMLPEDLTTKHNAHQLKDMLRDFDARMTTQLEKRRDLQRDMQAAEAALKSIAQEDRNLREQIGNLQAQKSAHEERLERRLKHMDAMAKAHEINLPVTQTGTQNTSFTSTQHSLANESMTTITGGTQETMLTVTPEDMQIFFKAVNEREADLKGDLASRRKANQQEIDKIQEDLNKISAEVTGVDNGAYCVFTKHLPVSNHALL
jgi:DNA repair protein RAD50